MSVQCIRLSGFSFFAIEIAGGIEIDCFTFRSRQRSRFRFGLSQQADEPHFFQSGYITAGMFRISNFDDFVKSPISALCAISQNFITPWRDCILRNWASLDLGLLTKSPDRDFLRAYQFLRVQFCRFWVLPVLAIVSCRCRISRFVRGCTGTVAGA